MRRAGSIWIQTAYTDKWTLQQQNDRGQATVAAIAAEKPGDVGLMAGILMNLSSKTV